MCVFRVSTVNANWRHDGTAPTGLRLASTEGSVRIRSETSESCRYAPSGGPVLNILCDRAVALLTNSIGMRSCPSPLVGADLK